MTVQYSILIILLFMNIYMGFPGGSVVKNPPVNAGDTGLIPEIRDQEDPLEKEMTTYCSILAWRIPWTESGSLQSKRSQKSWT